nr:hypothetical protein [Tanacetum cinerariifolium]GEY98558.1 hypothetical protein [Tanacetum cinerariifolium]
MKMLNSKPQSNIHANMAGLTLEENSRTGSQHEGLYFLDFNNKPETFIKCNNMIFHLNTLWHNRLGHPSDQVLKALKDRIDIRETDSHGDSENSFAPGGINEDASDNDSTSLGDFNNATDRELVTSPYDDITVEQSSSSEDNHNIINVNNDQPNLRKS